MEKAKNSKLSFEGFNITHSLINISGNIGQDMNIEIDPFGEIDKAEQLFRLFLKIKVGDNLKGLSIEVDASADFKVEGGDIDSPEFNNYLFLNAPAILFPYIRAYVTSLTGLSGISPIIIPLVNMEGLKENLKEQTKIV